MYRSVFNREITFISKKMQYPEQSKTEKLIMKFWVNKHLEQISNEHSDCLTLIPKIIQ